jgi:hypothetical protein
LNFFLDTKAYFGYYVYTVLNNIKKELTMSNKVIIDNGNCVCCGAAYPLDELMVDDCELVCVECVEDDVEHMSDNRLSVWDRNR